MKTQQISRRDLLKGTGALIVSFNLFGPISHVLAQVSSPLDAAPNAASLDSWIAVAADETITVFTSKVELGTGLDTALAQIVAEELDVPFGRVHMESGDTSKTIDQFATVGSRSIERAGPQLRAAAAAARQQLLKLAAQRLNAPAEKLTVSDGLVSVAGEASKNVSYGALLGNRRFNTILPVSGVGWDMKITPDAPLKSYKDYKIVGQPISRVDLPPKFTGEFTYTQDVRLPGMLHGRVVRPPVVNSQPSSVDESSIRNIPGVVKVVREGRFIGIVAETQWAAIQAAKALKVTWSEPTTKLPATADALYDYLKNTKSFRDASPVDRGSPEAALSQAAKKFEATYRWPFQLHGMLGPSCAVADVVGNKVTIYAGSQGPFRTRGNVAKLLGLPEGNVRVIYREGSGCYGRLSPDDAPEDAALMSRAVGRPVRVQWSRADEHGWSPKGPAHLIMARAGVDAQGQLVAWDYMDRGQPWSTTATPLLASQQVGLKANGQGSPDGTGGAGELYDIANQKAVAASIPWIHEDPSPLRTSNLRAPGDLARTFASESFIDEIAAALGVDPVQFRLRHLSDKRALEVLQAATRAAGWQQRPSPAPTSKGTKAVGRGFAIGDRANVKVAAVAEVEVDRSTGEVTVKRIVLAHDCGLIINPDGLRNQIEGNVIQGVSRTLLEEVHFDAAGVKDLDWVAYPVIRFRAVPEVHVELINRPEMPALGGGEPAIVPVPAAIANAVFDAVGARLRQVPLTPQRVLSSLRAAGSRNQSA